jgi:dCMP deaminase
MSLKNGPTGKYLQNKVYEYLKTQISLLNESNHEKTVREIIQYYIPSNKYYGTWKDFAIYRLDPNLLENIKRNVTKNIIKLCNYKYYMEDKRPSWDEYFKQIVQVTSTRSPCERLQVGCLLVKDNRIISQGYNGFLPGCPHKSIVRDNHEQATLHAEQNALMDCAKRGASCKDSTAYITHYPCIICCRLLLAAEIGEIKYINDYKNDDLVEVFAKQCCVKINKI